MDELRDGGSSAEESQSPLAGPILSVSLRRKASLLSESRGSTTRRLPAVCGPKAWILLCGVLLLWGTVAVGLSVRGAPAEATTSPRTFVDRALGSPSPDASLRRRLASGATLAIQDGSLAARDGSATIALSSSGGSDGDWRRFHGGASRATEFGRESILFGINRAEQFLTVERHHGDAHVDLASSTRATAAHTSTRRAASASATLGGFPATTSSRSRSSTEMDTT